jgi:hypothetical protein
MLAALVQLAGAGMMDQMLVRDSLRDIEPWLRPRWLAARGLSDYYAAHSWKPAADSGLACVGRWSYGPSVKVSLRVTADDTVVCLARGSGASVIRFRSQDSLTLALLSDINCSGITSRAIIKDTLVFCGMQQGGTGIEVWGISNLTSPHRLSYVYLPPIMDIAVQDTFLYAIGYQQDSLRIFNVADPHNPVQVGACADSGINGMYVAGEYCYLADQYGLYVVDVSDPHNPQRVGAVGGFEALAVTVRDTLCFVGTYTSEFALRVYNVRNPATPIPVGSLAGIEAHDIYLPPTCDTVLYTPKLHVINIANPASPRQIGFVDCPGWDYGVVAVPTLNFALVADYFKGMVAVNISNPIAPLVDTMAFAGDEARDITIDNGKAYVASYHAGLQILDVGDPTRPSYLGSYDTAGTSGVVRSATAKDSFAFTSWPMPRMLSMDVTDPHHPLRAAGCAGMFNPPEDMVVRDSFVYVVGVNRFQIVNVARPREPVLVGTSAGDGVAIVVQDSFAYTAAGAIRITNVARPDSPFVVSTIGRASRNLQLLDTLLVCAPGPVMWFDVTDPTAPVLVDSIDLGHSVYGLTAVDTIVYASTAGNLLYAISIADLHGPRILSQTTLPYTANRIVYAASRLYLTCWEAGVCIFETASVGVRHADKPTPLATWLAVRPNPTRSLCEIEGRWKSGSSIIVIVRDVAGRAVLELPKRTRPAGRLTLDLSKLEAGVYFLDVKDKEERMSVKLVKQ